MRKDRGELLYLPDIMQRTKMPEGTIRSRYLSGTMPCLWKLGRRLVAWERDLEEWLEAQRAATTKTRASVTQALKGEETEVAKPEERLEIDAREVEARKVAE